MLIDNALDNSNFHEMTLLTCLLALRLHVRSVDGRPFAPARTKES